MNKFWAYVTSDICGNNAMVKGSAIPNEATHTNA